MGNDAQKIVHHAQFSVHRLVHANKGYLWNSQQKFVLLGAWWAQFEGSFHGVTSWLEVNGTKENLYVKKPKNDIEVKRNLFRQLGKN